MRGEKIRHKASGYPLLGPKAALLWNTLHLRKKFAPTSTPLAHVMILKGRYKNITPTIISKTLNTTVKL